MDFRFEIDGETEGALEDALKAGANSATLTEGSAISYLTIAVDTKEQARIVYKAVFPYDEDFPDELS